MKIRFEKPEKKRPEQDRGLHVTYGSSRRAMASWRWYLILAVICSPIALQLYKLTAYFFQATASGYILMPQTEIRATHSGYIKKLPITVMQHVQSGDLLYQLDEPELDKKISLVAAELDFLQKLSMTPPQVQILPLNNQLLVEQKKHAQKRLADYTQLFNQGAATSAELANARAQYQAAEDNLLARQTENQRNIDARKLQEQQAKHGNDTRIMQLIHENQSLEFEKLELAYSSPVDGVISDVRVTSDEYVARGDVMMSITKSANALINAFIKPEDIEYAVVGQTAMIHFANGENVAAKIVLVPSLTKLVSGASAEVFNERQREIIVQLEFTELVKQPLMNGLAVEISF